MQPSRVMSRLSLAFVVAVAASCSPEGEKPPPYVCSGRCAALDSPNIGQVPPPGGEGGSGGSSSDGDDPVRLMGELVLLDDIPDLRASPLREPADLLVEGAEGDVEGRYDGIDSFSLDGVLQASVAWALATPGPGDTLPTLQPVDTTRPNTEGAVTTTLTVVRESELDRAFSLLSLPISRDPANAQVVVVVMRNQRGAAGVQVVAPAAEIVVYAENGGFSDTATSTDASGVVVLANVPASDWPGSGVAVTLTGTVAGRWDLRVVSGAVTFAGISE
jgi:hypothetical protein